MRFSESHYSGRWRLIDTGPLSGPDNMALDEALLSSFDQLSEPVLRLYGWQPAAISVGRFQKVDEVLDVKRCRDDGLAIVRRITGGGVIYHADELTYSIICAPGQIPTANSIKDSFRVLTGFLLGFYRSLGLNADYALNAADGEKLGDRTPFCFAGRESFDILIKNRKIGGNAQRRLKQVVFQHGSIPLLNRVDEGVAYMLDKPSGLPSRVCSLADEGVAPDTDFLKPLLIESFSRSMSARLSEESPTEEETEMAAELLREKYLNDCWNINGEMSGYP